MRISLLTMARILLILNDCEFVQPRHQTRGWFLGRLRRSSSGKFQVHGIPIKDADDRNDSTVKVLSLEPDRATRSGANAPGHQGHLGAHMEHSGKLSHFCADDLYLAIAQTLGSTKIDQRIGEVLFQAAWLSCLKEAGEHEEALWLDALEKGQSLTAFKRWLGREVERIRARHEPRLHLAQDVPTKVSVIRDMQTEIKALKIPNSFKGILKAPRRTLKIEDLKNELESYDARVYEAKKALRSSKRWEALRSIPWLSLDLIDKPGRLYAERLVKEQYTRDFEVSLKTVERSRTQLRKHRTGSSPLRSR